MILFGISLVANRVDHHFKVLFSVHIFSLLFFGEMSVLLSN